MKPTLRNFLIPALVAPVLSAQVIEDDFNDGNDSGWERYAPLAALGAPATFSFPGGSRYRIQSPPSPDAALAGPARAGAHRANTVYEAFRVEVDLVAWNNGLEQDIGVLGSLGEVGPGTTNGYALSYSYTTEEEALFISVLSGEQPNSLGSASVTLIPGQRYRMVFQGFFDVDEFYGQLCGEIFSLNDLETPLATVFGSNFDYPSGTCGVFTNSITDTGRTDATFDNYFSTSVTDVDKDGMSDQWEFEYFGELYWFAEEDFDEDGQANLEEFLGGSDPTDPNSLSGSVDIGDLDVRVANGDLTVGFTWHVGWSYELETSSDLQNWSSVPGAVFSVEPTKRPFGAAAFDLPVAGQDELYFRVVGSQQ